MEALRAEVQALQRRLAELQKEREAAGQNAEAEAARLRQRLGELTAANAALEREAAEGRRGAEEKAAKLRKALDESEAALRASEEACKALKAQLEASKKEAANKAAEVHSALKEQIDDAAQSSVRLCVVAPTVNVTFGDQVLSYKAPLPKERIKSTLELQVLPNFAKGFIQQKEGLAPDGSPMDDWLKEMTVTMQGSIEKHLSRVFRQEQ